MIPRAPRHYIRRSSLLLLLLVLVFIAIVVLVDRNFILMPRGWTRKCCAQTAASAWTQFNDIRNKYNLERIKQFPFDSIQMRYFDI